MSTIRVQMPSGTGSVSVAGHSYTADEDGIVHLEHAEHVAPLVQAGGVELDENGNAGGQQSVLIGSDSLPATNDLGEGREPISLGELVRQTQGKTGISVDEWNNLPARIRDILLGFNLARLRGDLVEAGGGPTEADIEHYKSELDKERQNGARLALDLEAARAQLDELRKSTDNGPSRPDFGQMTKAQINVWLEANGGTPIAAGSHPEHVAAADARWSELHPATED